MARGLVQYILPSERTPDKVSLPAPGIAMQLLSDSAETEAEGTLIFPVADCLLQAAASARARCFNSAAAPIRRRHRGRFPIARTSRVTASSLGIRSMHLWAPIRSSASAVAGDAFTFVHAGFAFPETRSRKHDLG